MTRYYRKSRSSRRTRNASRLLPSIMLVLVGSAGFYMALQWFRDDAEQDPALAAETAAVAVQEVEEVNPAAVAVEEVAPLAKVVESSAPLVSAYDGQHTGRVQRYVREAAADMVVLAYLPTLDMAADSYHVWLLKDGLADVKDMGELAPRADGSWVLNFSADAAAGIVDARQYGTLVITREPNDGNSAPSGNRIAEAVLDE